MHKIDEVHVKRFLSETIWNIAPSKMRPSLTAVIPTPAATGNVRIHHVVGNEGICLDPFSCGGYLSETRSGGGRGKKRRPHSTAQPRTVALKVFRVSILTALEDSDRVDSAQTTVKLSIWDIAAHTVCWGVVRTTA